MPDGVSPWRIAALVGAGRQVDSDAAAVDAIARGVVAGAAVYACHCRAALERLLRVAIAGEGDVPVCGCRCR